METYNFIFWLLSDYHKGASMQTQIFNKDTITWALFATGLDFDEKKMRISN